MIEYKYNQIPKTEIVYELKEKHEFPSYEEFMEGYEVDLNLNYGDLNYEDISEIKSCGPTNKKKSRSKSSSIDYNEQHLIDTLNRKICGKSINLWEFDEFVIKEKDKERINFSTSGEASLGVGGDLLSGEASLSYYNYEDNNGSIKFGRASLGGEIGAGPSSITAGYSANIDLVRVSSKGFSTNIGLDGGNNFTAGLGGVEVKAAGLELALEKIWDLALH